MTWSEPQIRNRKTTWKIVLTLVLLASLGNIGKAERDEDRLTYVVTLRQPSVVEEVLATQLSGSRQSRRQAIRSAATSDRRRMINQAQLRVIDQLITLRNRLPGLAPDIELLDRRYFLTNSLVIKATPEAAARLARDPEVKGMVLNRIRYPLLDSALLVVRAPAIWEAIPGGVVNAGREMRIGIIDSGINHEHPMFEGDGLTPPPGFPAGSSSHTNNKVIVARAYPHLFPNPQANRTPDDEMGHGSRVAAVAAGRHVLAPHASIRGIAPLAFVGSYKVFGAPGSNTVTTSAAIIAALNDAVSDGMDVINLSLGGPGVDPETDPEQQAIALAVEAGTVVVAAAGAVGVMRRHSKTVSRQPLRQRLRRRLRPWWVLSAQ